MHAVINLEPFYPHHELLIEIGRIELALEYMKSHSDSELRPRLESRMKSLQQQLDRMAA